MTDLSATPDPSNATPGADAVQAGALLRAARQQQGLHIAALAASIKVTPAKLEALESGRTDELLDLTFARALALTVCRVLKIDPVPVLALMPGAPPGSLARVDSGLNTPFRERAGHGDAAAWLPWRHPALWLTGLLLVAAAAFVLVPSQPGQLPGLPLLDGGVVPVVPVMPPGAADGLTTTTEPAAGTVPAAVDAPAPAASGALGSATSTAPGAAAAAASAALAATAAAASASASQPKADGALVLRAVQATWVQAVDGSGQTLMARLVPAGETVALTPALPVRLRIGNAQGTELLFRGQPVNLTATTRDNIANITLP